MFLASCLEHFLRGVPFDDEDIDLVSTVFPVERMRDLGEQELETRSVRVLHGSNIEFVIKTAFDVH